MPDTLQTRKVGDALILSGQLNEATPLEDALWEGAVGAINIVALDGPNGTPDTVYVDHAAVTLTIDETPKRYSVILPAPAEEDIGAYVYEIEVTFPDLDDPLTFPNDKTRYKLKIVAQAGMTPLQTPPVGHDGVVERAAGYLLALVGALVATLWGLVNRRITVLEVANRELPAQLSAKADCAEITRLDAVIDAKASAADLAHVEALVAGKADATEMLRQRDGLAEVFRELRKMREQSAQESVATLTLIHNKIDQVRTDIAEATLDRRNKARDQ